MEGSIVVWAEGWVSWPVGVAADLTPADLEPVRSRAESIDILLIGCGPAFGPEPDGLRDALKAAGIALEWMDTGAACRTYNVLIGEGRRVAAALIAV